MGIRVKTLTSGKKKYRADVWHKSRRISKTFSSRQLAKEWEAQTKRELESVGIESFKKKEITLDTFFLNEYWPNKEIREGTAKDYERIYLKRIKPAFGNRLLASIQPCEWTSFLLQLTKNGTSEARADRVHATASAIYKAAVFQGLLPSNPLTRVKWFKKKNSVKSALKKSAYWKLSESQTFLEWACVHSVYFTLYLTAYQTGLRISELMALQWDVVDLDRHEIEIRRYYCRLSKAIQENTKSGKIRRVYLSPDLANRLRMLKDSSPGLFVFTNTDGQMFPYETMRAQAKRDQIEAKVPVIGWHGFRHTFASHFMMNGGNIYELQKLLGHSDVSTTMIYAHLGNDHLKETAGRVQFVPTANNIVQLNRIAPDSRLEDETKP